MKHFRKCRGGDDSPTQKRLWLHGRQAFSQVFWRGKGAGGAAGEEENSLAASMGVMEALGCRPDNLSGWGSWDFGCSWLQAVPHLWGLPLADQNTPLERYPHHASWGLADTGAQKASPPHLSMGTILYPMSQRVRLRLVSAGFSALSYFPSLLSVNGRHLNLYFRPHF